ncbi:uncharacterized protein SCHCODRAFT_01187647 [Schizophyllum commune H4-8]|nr:uncharacterized protein SCHCODRAFT_01187647 [Schizophyllum commune H4-8]KAI5899186.1 hypothetical protein SCHCODRAFT_01187647 [Schizophyllum commune H4-8]
MFLHRPEGEASITRGCLIDLDLDLGKRKIASHAYSAFMEREFGEVAPILSMVLQFYYDKGMLIGQVDADVSSSALRAMARTAVTKAQFPEAQSRALTYVNEAVAYMVNHRGADPDQTFTLETLRWDVEFPDSTPLFSRATSGTGQRQSWYCSETLPFMSPEMLGTIPIFDNAESKLSVRANGDDTDEGDIANSAPEAQCPTIAQGAIHDMEALFWALLYICITRGGPGGRRREEYSVKNLAATADPKRRQSIAHLHKITHCLFEAQDPATLSKYKRVLLRNGVRDFKAHIEGRFHEYFEPFKPTMRAYLQLLRIAYIFRGYEYHFIHDRVLELLHDLLENLSDASYDEGQEVCIRAELKEREGSVKGLQ